MKKHNTRGNPNYKEIKHAGFGKMQKCIISEIIEYQQEKEKEQLLYCLLFTQIIGPCIAIDSVYSMYERRYVIFGGYGSKADCYSVKILSKYGKIVFSDMRFISTNVLNHKNCMLCCEEKKRSTKMWIINHINKYKVDEVLCTRCKNIISTGTRNITTYGEYYILGNAAIICTESEVILFNDRKTKPLQRRNVPTNLYMLSNILNYDVRSIIAKFIHFVFMRELS